MPNWWDGLDEEGANEAYWRKQLGDQGEIRKSPPRSFWQRFTDNLFRVEPKHYGPAPAIARRITPYVQAHLDRNYDRDMGDKRTIAQRRDAARKKIVQDERDWREVRANDDAPDSVGDYVADIAGGIGAAAYSDPTTYIGGVGKTIGERLFNMAGMSGLADLVMQGGEIQEGVRDKIDPYQASISTAAPVVLGGAAYGAKTIKDKISTGRRVARGSKMPGWQEVNDVIIRDLEGGGTLERPKVSPKGAMGPQQVMPDTARRPGFGIRPWDGKSQADLARVGRQYSAAMMDKYDGDVEKVLAAYNAGPGRVDGLVKRYGDDWQKHLPGETKAYVSKGLRKLGREVGPEDLGDVRLVQDEIPTVAEMARANNALAPNEGRLADNVSEFPLSERLEDDLILDNQVNSLYEAFKHPDLTPDELRDIQAKAEFQRGSLHPIRQKNTIELIDEILAAPRPVEDVLTPAERQEMDASATRPDIEPTKPPMIGKGRTNAPANDTFGALEIYPSEANRGTARDGLTYYDIQFNTPWGKVTADLSVRSGRGEIDIAGNAENKLGPAILRKLAKTLIAEIPELKSFAGFRVTGARQVSKAPKSARDVNIKFRKAPHDGIGYDPSSTQPIPLRDLSGKIIRPTAAERQKGRYMRGPDHPEGGNDAPSFDIRRTLAGSEEALSQIEAVRASGNMPLTVSQLSDALKSWRKEGLEVIKSQGDPELREEALTNIKRIISELEGMQDRLLAEPPKAAPAKDAAKPAPKGEKKPRKKKTAAERKFEEEGYPELPPVREFRDPPEKPPEPPRGDDGDGEGPDRDKYLGSINTERLDMNQETYAILDEIMADHQFDHVTYGEMKLQAEEILKNTSVSDILTADPKLSEAIPYQIAIRTILMDSLGKEVEISRMVLDPSQRSDELIGMQNLQRVKTAAAADAASGIAGQAGRLLSSFKINVGEGSTSAKAIQEMLKLNPGRMDPVSYAEAFLAMWNNKEGRVKMAKDALNPNMVDYITQLRYSMMLSGIGTHVKNTVETMKVLGQTIAENLGAVPVGMATRSADRVTTLESAGRIYGLWRAALNADTYKNAVQSFKEGTPVNKVSKIEGGEMLMPFPFNLPQRALASADSFWRGFIELSDIYGMSMRKASGEGLTGKEMWDRGEEIAQEAFDKAAMYNQARKDLIAKKIKKKDFEEIQLRLGDYKDIIEHSEHHAEVVQMLSEPSILTRGIERMKTRKPNMSAVQKVGRLAAQMLFPFARVSDRLFFHSIRRSPLFFLDNESMAAWKKGGAERDQVISRVLMGSAMLSLYAAQAMNDQRTGEGPRNPQKRRALEAGGWQPNSTFDPETGTYRDSTAFATVGIPAGMVATLVERYKAGELGEEGYMDGMADLLRQFLQGFKNNTYLEGGGSLFSALEDNPLGDTAWANFWGGMGASFVPAAARQANNTIDPVARDTTGDRSFEDRVIGRIKSGIPGMSDDLPARSDVYGQIVTKDPDIGTAITGVGKERKAVTDPVMVELQRLEKGQGNTLVTPPSKAWKGRTLNAEEFQEYQRLSGQVFIDAMREEMITFEWLDMSDDQKKERVKKVLNASRKEVRDMLFPKQEEPENWWEGLE